VKDVGHGIGPKVRSASDQHALLSTQGIATLFLDLLPLLDHILPELAGEMLSLFMICIAMALTVSILFVSVMESNDPGSNAY
jgi:hypothetical protein